MAKALAFVSAWAIMMTLAGLVPTASANDKDILFQAEFPLGTMTGCLVAHQAVGLFTQFYDQTYVMSAGDAALGGFVAASGLDAVAGGLACPTIQVPLRSHHLISFSCDTTRLLAPNAEIEFEVSGSGLTLHYSGIGFCVMGPQS